MTQYNNLKSLKIFAKRLARTKRIPHHEALDLIAEELGQAHWNALTSAWETGWRPKPLHLETLADSPNAPDPAVMAIPKLGLGLGTEEHGNIDGHAYSLEIDFEVLMGGQGWAICVEQAPSEKPAMEIYDDREDNPLLNPQFVSKALEICNVAAEKLRARIAADWPRRSMKPDADGQTRHPLFKDRGLSNKWYCLHCDELSTGAQMAANIWHCPKCSATPIDIFAEPFWKAAS